MKFRDKVKIAANNAYNRALSEGISGGELTIFMFIQGVIFAEQEKSVKSIEDKYKEILENDGYDFEIEDCKYDYINNEESSNK